MDRPSRRLWIACQEGPVRALYAPIMLALASGRLDMQVFDRFFNHCIEVLKAIDACYVQAETYAITPVFKIGIGDLRNRLVMLRRLIARKLPACETSDPYTNFLHKTASVLAEDGGGGTSRTPFGTQRLAAHMLAATAPFMSLSEYLSNGIENAVPAGAENHIYKRWIQLSGGFKEIALQNEKMLDTLHMFLTGDELDTFEKIYSEAMQIEVDFIYGLLDARAVVPLALVQDLAACPLIIFCNFDHQTCTSSGSAASLAQVAINLSSSDLKPTWSSLCWEYEAGFQSRVHNIVTTNKGEGFRYHDLCLALEALAEFDKEANAKVVKSNILRGLNLNHIREAGQALHLQLGCESFFESVGQSKYVKAIHMLSYCWSSDLISSAIVSEKLKIQSNDLEFDGFVTSGNLVRKLEAPTEKLEAFCDILKEEEDGHNLTIYIGGSVGDILCLLAADVGIVISDSVSSSLDRLCERFGITLVPLFSSLVRRLHSQEWEPEIGTLYTVSSWAEIQAFILGSGQKMDFAADLVRKVTRKVMSPTEPPVVAFGSSVIWDPNLQDENGIDSHYPVPGTASHATTPDYYETLDSSDSSSVGSSDSDGYCSEAKLEFVKRCRRLFAGEMQILMVGLTGAGKTTILRKLKLGKIVTTTPAIGFNVETLKYKDSSITVWEVGGPDEIRPLWRQYYQSIQRIVFVVDSNDRNRVVEARNELTLMMNEEALLDCALLVFANKQDLPNAMTAEEISGFLGLDALRQCHWHIQSTCATSGEGLFKGLAWLVNPDFN